MSTCCAEDILKNREGSDLRDLGGGSAATGCEPGDDSAASFRVGVTSLPGLSCREGGGLDPMLHVRLLYYRHCSPRVTAAAVRPFRARLGTRAMTVDLRVSVNRKRIGITRTER